MARAGGLLALAATVLLPFHLGGGFGGWIAAGFLAGGFALGLASLALAKRFPRRAVAFRSWAVIGAAGFLTSGAALLADVLDHRAVAAEVTAIVATAVWWVVVWRRLAGETRFADFSLLCAVSAGAALVAQALGLSPPGAVPARFVYVLWGPWGLWLAVVLRRRAVAA